MDYVRPSTETQSCPEGYVPCSEFTSLDKTFCVGEDQKHECPITDFMFMPLDEEVPENFISAGGDFNGLHLAYTRDSDEFAIGKTSLEYKPCYISYLSSEHPDSKYYPLENDRWYDCYEDDLKLLTYDDRYVSAGMQISEFEV